NSYYLFEHQAPKTITKHALFRGQKQGTNFTMKPLLNTLFVTAQGAYLSREGEQLVVRVDDEEKLRIAAHTLSGIVCFGRVNASPALMALCAEKKIGLSFLTENGKFLARVTGPVSGNVLL